MKSFILFSSWYSGGERKRSASNLQSKPICQKKNIQKQKMLASSLVNKKQQVEHSHVYIYMYISISTSFKNLCTAIRSQSCWLRRGHQPILQRVQCSWDCKEPTCRMVQSEDRLHWSPAERTERSIKIYQNTRRMLIHSSMQEILKSLHITFLLVPCASNVGCQRTTHLNLIPAKSPQDVSHLAASY